ncbi:MAG: hypothetical protein Q9166_001783 [cf. Caloplaca sp. 2 TL-2023]
MHCYIFAVDATGLFEVDFDIGESYAGLLPYGPSDNSSLFFWFFPSNNSDADEITVWMSGGPGCNSLIDLLYGTGPFLWLPGTSQPDHNPFSWTHVTNIVYIDYPADRRRHPFNDFWKNFVTTFAFQNHRVYLTGQGYAGKYIPYIAEDMLKRNDPTYYNLRGIQIHDALINSYDTLREAPAASYMNSYSRYPWFERDFQVGHQRTIRDLRLR